MTRTGGPLLQARVSRSGTTVTVRLRGELDLATAGELRSCLAPVIGSQPPPVKVVLDLEAVTFLDASGIAALLTARRALDAHGGRLVLRSPSRLVRRVMRVLDLEGVLPVEG